MDTSTDLKQQAQDIMQEVDAFLKGDHSHLSAEEFARQQEHMMAKQSMAMAALLQHMGFKHKKPLMQSEDMADLKRRAGITEASNNRTFDQMKKIVQLAHNYMQNDKVDGLLTAKNIVYLAQQIGED